jgi:pimeloyl-ACP methyl ester carboxylesterase/uncharacterized protein YukE
MSRMVGADLHELRSLAASFDRAATELRRTSTTVRNGIQISAWVGPFAVRFRKTWDSEHSVKLTRAAAALASQARQLRQEADQQEQASRAHTTGGGAGVTSAPLGHGRLSDRDLVAFARSASSDRPGITSHGYTALTDAELRDLGIDPATLHDASTGFDAKVYRDGAGRLIVAFGGTEPDQGGDWKSDVVGANHYALSRQGEQGVDLAVALRDHVGSENLVLTGHSLGGRNAALASVATGARAVTFNAAGVSAGDHLYASTAGGGEVSLLEYAVGTAGVPLAAPHVTNYATTTDPLTWFQVGTPAPDALGEQHRVGSDKYWLDSHSDFHALEARATGD